MRKRFLPILGRSVRADLIGRQFWANPADFGKNRRFRGFGLVDGLDIARAREDFCRSLVDVPTKTSQRSPCIWIFLKKAWISRFQFDPVHLGPPMRPALTDRPMRPRIGKNLTQFDSVRWIARAGSVRHVQFCIFTQ